MLNIFLNNPPSLNWDEVSLGYNAFSLLKTGRDEWGTILPLIFRAFGDFKLPAYVYFTVPVPFAVRLLSVIFGLLLIVISYLLGRRFFSNQIGLITALLVAISPWTWWLSRIALEANAGAFLIVLGIYCLLSKKYNLGILFLGLSVWTYNSARIFSPLFLLGFFFINRRHIRLSTMNYLLITILFIPMFLQLLLPTGQARYQTLSLLDSGAIARIEQLQTTRPGGRLLYNKVTYWTGSFLKNYLSYISPNFLFLKGGNHYQFSIQNFGLLYLVCLPFFYFGVLDLIKNSKLKIKNSLILWLLLAPIAGSLTRDAPHVLRAIPMLPLPMLLTAVGLSRFGRNIKIIFIVGLLVSSIYYLVSANNYRSNYSQSWQYGYAQTIQFIKDHYDQYDRIIFTKKYGEPHEFVAYYWPWHPANFQSQKQWDYHANWYWVNSLDKFTFVNDWEMTEYIKTLDRSKKYLIVQSPEHETTGTEVFWINFLDDKPAFIIKTL